jgi:hypothetical protein
MAEAALQFVIEKLLRPLGIDLSLRVFMEAAMNSESALNEMKQAVYSVLAEVLFANKQEGRAWIHQCSPSLATDILRLMGFDPFLFDLDNSSQHLLITLCWLIWRADLFKTVYEPLLPKDDSCLPPYGPLCADENDILPRALRPAPENPDDLTARIQRLAGRIPLELQMLSDLEVTREELHWKIREIDPDSSLYALSLKTKPDLLNAHVEALRRVVQNSDKLKQLADVEQTFWRCAFNLFEGVTIDTDRFEATKSLPAEWYPPLTRAPFTYHNKAVDDLEEAMARLRRALAKCTDVTKHLKLRDLQRDLNRRQVDLIVREIDDMIESLERMDEIKTEEQEQSTEKLIPELPFKTFSDTELRRIIVRCERKCEDIAKRSCSAVAEMVAQMCEQVGYEAHGWRCKVKELYVEDHDSDAEPPPLRKPPKKPPVRATVPAKPKPRPLRENPPNPVERPAPAAKPGHAKVPAKKATKTAASTLRRKR